MDVSNSIQKQAGASFRLLNGTPDYLTFEEIKKDPENLQIVSRSIRDWISLGRTASLKRMSFIIHQDSSYYEEMKNILLQRNFEYFSSKVMVYRDLPDCKAEELKYEWHNLEEESVLTEEGYKDLWGNCMSGSENARSTLSMEEHLRSVKLELGPYWRKSCYAVYENNKPLGIAIPHIEPGTSDEGRLFYFGLVPEERGKGKSAGIHRDSLVLLHRLGAAFYVGSTDQANHGMQKVFLNNDCRITSLIESYYYYFS
ncbi:GNAT family N-acetyltransferase [Bacillus sp. V59.32b]|uniref:GNAT family N-acetyltransferase n=1 Tax=Bacillus sp. V59.32b TaxID=1758642 RepID=UPI000E3CA77E|nr:GNAT family N-acetyltransferase [Bacillus sp. V59.32b]RFU60107.1 GNAT family N-acetyltransferase [Bacillus sp. V59.32b]